MDKIAEFLKSYSGKKVILITHHNADPDAVGSVYALSEALKQLGCETVMSAAESISKLSKKILKELDAVFVTSPVLDGDLIILLDTSTPGQLSSYADAVLNSDIPKVIIDHHSTHDKTITATHSVIDKSAKSTTQLVYDLIPLLGAKLDQKMALAIIFGLITDTAHFRFADVRVFETLTKLMKEFDISPAEVMEKLSLVPDISERIAILKGVQRISFEKIENYLVATTVVGAFEAATARALLRVGADVAIVAAHKDNEARVSMRSKRHFYEETKVDLGVDLAPELGKIIEGSGSGHPNAAGVNGKNTKNINTALTEAVKIIKQKVLK